MNEPDRKRETLRKEEELHRGDDGLAALRESHRQAEAGQAQPIEEAFARIREKLIRAG